MKHKFYITSRSVQSPSNERKILDATMYQHPKLLIDTKSLRSISRLIFSPKRIVILWDTRVILRQTRLDYQARDTRAM